MSRPGFDIYVPQQPNIEAAQAALSLSAERLAEIAYDLAQDPTVHKKQAGPELGYQETGFVVPFHHDGQTLYIRALYPQKRDLHDEGYIPTDKEGLVAHMHWYATEQQRLRDAGALLPSHFPVLVRDAEQWGNTWGILIAAAEVEGSINSSLLFQHNLTLEQPVRSMGKTMLKYFTDPSRRNSRTNGVIGDLVHPRQAIGQTIIDLDPYRSTETMQLRLLHKVITSPGSALLTPCLATDALGFYIKEALLERRQLVAPENNTTCPSIQNTNRV